MTSYGTYDAGLPCKNPNCKSHGKPHPNCKCYGDMAEGGDVGFCSQAREHNSHCEYFANGGIVGSLGDMDPGHAIAGHILHHGFSGLLKGKHNNDVAKYDKSVGHGHTAMDVRLEQIFRNERIKHSGEDRSKKHKMIDEWIAKGGSDDDLQEELYGHHRVESFAEGGKVEGGSGGIHNGHPVEKSYPEHNILMQATKGRVSNYLGSLRPQEMQMKLPFDSNRNQKNQKKTYERAMKIADHPLSVLQDLSHGKMKREDLQHLGAMYPEIKDAIQKKATEKIIKAQLDGKKPNYKVRQSLSMLMGVPLSSQLTPQSIQAAQSVFAAKPPQSQKGQPPQGGKATGSAKSLTKSDNSFLTGEQARVARDQKRS